MRAPQDIFSVGELTAEIKTLLEEAYPAVWVRGEVGNCKVQASGHAYFSLKDERAQLSAVAFRGTLAKTPLRLREGMQIIAFGRLNVYEPRGNYQLVVQTFLEDGVGRLQIEFERLKRRLEAEGLFDRQTKKEIPKWVERAGFVTSPTGAVIRDFTRILSRGGWRGEVLLFPAKVQGAQAAEEMARQIQEAQKWNLDVLVVGRGGGSLEDLWAFNEEALVRAVAASEVPVISAVGHETDFTLCDFAADLRAETPSAAASLLVANREEMRTRCEQAQLALLEHRQSFFEDKRLALDLLRKTLLLHSPQNAVEQAQLRLDDWHNRLEARRAALLQSARHALEKARARWQAGKPAERIARLKIRLEGLGKRLGATGIEGTLKRGFVLLSDREGGIVSRRSELKKPLPLIAHFADGKAPLHYRGEEE